MSKGISTDLNVTNLASCLAGSNDFIFRYYSSSDWKVMSATEAVALNHAGLKLAAVYEDGPTDSQADGYFTAARGTRHGANAYEYASEVIHQPPGSAIYFAVDHDYDPSDAANLQGIVDYFTAVRAEIERQSGKGGALDYKVGVYGSGFVCRMIKESKSLAEYSWLAESPGWNGYAGYKGQCNVLQAIAGASVCGITDYEDCTAGGEFGAFSLSGGVLPAALLAGGAPVPQGDNGHGSSNPHPKPPIKKFIQSPNHSSRNGAKIEMVVLHCTEESLDGTINDFLDPGGRQVSAHYVIDQNGDIYQMVSDSDRANHCMGANANTIGIEHVAASTEALTTAQSASSAALMRWLLEQYDIGGTDVYGHDFTPGYDRPGGTSCPDRLFGPTHDQASITAWVQANV